MMESHRKPQEAKKAIESHYLQWFLKQVGWDYQFDDSEQPDFLLHAPDGVIGIEVTGLFKNEGSCGSPIKARENKRSRVLGMLASKYYSQGGSPLLVKALLSQSSITDDDASRILNRLEKERPATNGDQIRFEEGLSDGSIAVFYLTALPPEMREYSRWQCANNSTGHPAPATPEMLIGKIKEKATKLSQYQRKTGRIILLIVADRTKDSGMFQYPPSSDILPNHGFSEVHLLDYPIKSHKIA